MNTRFRKFAGLSALVVFGLVLSACGAAAPAEPTQDPNMVFTQVAETVMVSMTQTAQAVPPTAMPEPTITPLPTQPPAPTQDPNMPTQAPPQMGPTPTIQKFGDSAAYLSINPADGTTFDTGEEIRFTICFRNDGSTDWNKNYYLQYVGGFRLWGDTNRWYVGEEIEPGGKWCFFLPGVTPREPGTHITYYDMKNPSGQVIAQAYFTYKTQ